MEKVHRIEKRHKGFDYDKLVELLNNYFTVIKVEGIPFPTLPVQINFTVGIVLEKK